MTHLTGRGVHIAYIITEMPEQVLSVRSRAGAGKSAIVKLGGRVALQKPGRGWNVLVIDGATNLKRSNQSFDTYGAPAAAATPAKVAVSTVTAAHRA